MAKHHDVAVIGGGIIGLTCAYSLTAAGLSVEVFDQGDLGREASWAGAGILPPGNPQRAATPIDRLRAIGSSRFPDFSVELHDLTDIDNGYIRCGGIEFLDHEEAAEVLPLWDAEGIAFEKLTPAALRAIEPGLVAPPGEPYLLPDCAQVRNPRHLAALIAGCERVGVTLRPNARVDRIAADPKHPSVAAGVVDGTETRSASAVLIAAGAWSETFLTQRSERAPGVHPVRGQIVLLKTPERVVTRVLMIGKRYLVPRADGHVLIGSTEEPEARFEKANTAAAIAELVALATRTVPALASAEQVKCWSGLRPGSPDGLPFIGPVPGWDNVHVATGHFRAGVQLSLGTARLVTEMLTGRPSCVPSTAFAVDRTPHSGGKPAFRS
ncbi:NAD(P)/FAD-dependent oxidoreductase [Gemmata sp.]|uniref:NAD(P)/FAD-dependent oxidoreductase n=1 Tax=Gemmata sp. TaxID=1914242 RepID=UPI003F71A89F